MIDFLSNIVHWIINVVLVLLIGLSVSIFFGLLVGHFLSDKGDK